MVQFTAPVAPGSSGGALVDQIESLGSALSRLGKGLSGSLSPDRKASSALPDSGVRVALGMGASLQMPQNAADAEPSSATAAGSDGKHAQNCA